MEDAIYEKNLGEVTIENAIAKKDEIAAIKENYESLTNAQKEFVETTAKEKLDTAMDTLEVAGAVEKINEIRTVTKENASQKKTLIDDAQKAYDALTDAQKKIVPDSEGCTESDTGSL